MKLAAICQLPIEWINGNWQLAANFTDIILGKVTCFSVKTCIFFLENAKNRGAVVEWLEQLGYGAESRRIA